MVPVVLFGRDGSWQDTLVCEERIEAALRGAGVVQGHGPQNGAVGPGWRVLRTSGDADVYYLPRDDGWLGVLCAAGDWIAVPEELAFFPAGTTGPGSDHPLPLPSQDDFIAHLLSLLGEDAQEDLA